MSDIKSYKGKSKSISSSQILPENYDFENAKLVMREMIQNGCYQLFRQGYVTSLLHLFIGYGDDRSQAKGSIRMPVTTNLFSFIVKYMEKLFDDIVDKKKPIRKIGYDFAELKTSEYEQYDLFTDLKEIEKEKQLVTSILEIQDKYGKNFILKGEDLTEKATQRERNSQIGGHKSGEN